MKRGSLYRAQAGAWETHVMQRKRPWVECKGNLEPSPAKRSVRERRNDIPLASQLKTSNIITGFSG